MKARILSPGTHATRGSALLLVLMVLFMLTAAVFAFVSLVQGNLERANEESRGLEAKAMAHSGLAIALHPLVSEKTPGLEEELDADRGYKVRIVGEGGRLNINWVLPGHPAKRGAQSAARYPRAVAGAAWLEF